MLLLLLDWVVFLFGLIPILVFLLLLYRLKLRPTPPKTIRKADWVKDVVYLYQFPVCPSVRTISPFALKLETWLRMAEIKYENVFTMKFSSKGQIPYIELNGEEIPDSNIIICRLKAHFDVDPDAACSPTERAMGHAATGMVEHHLAHVGFYYRYGLNMPCFLRVLRLGEYWGVPRMVANWGRFQPLATRFRSYLQGIGRHEKAEIWQMSFQDLRALSDWLGNKPFFLGATPTTVDCVLFGHLAQFLYIDIGFPQRSYLEEECPNLVSLMARLRGRYWPRWAAEIEEAREAHHEKTS